MRREIESRPREQRWKPEVGFSTDSIGFVLNRNRGVGGDARGKGGAGGTGWRRADQSCQVIVSRFNGTSPGAKYRGVELN